jgi:Flp pilus assembly protein TadG
MLPTKRAQALVEMALMAPVLFLMVLGATDLSQLFYYSTSITNAAREGARHGAYFDPMGTPTPGNTFANDSAIFSAVNSEASWLALTEPCHPNTACTGGLTNCPSYPYASTLYPPTSAANTGYVFICFNNSTTATTTAVGQPIRVTILYSFQPVTPLIGNLVYSAASTEILTQGNG